MNTRPIIQLLLIGGLVAVLAACRPIQAPAATGAPPATPAPLPIESVDAAQCAALQAALSEQLGHALTKQEGAACTLVATGTGEDFGSFVDVAQTIREVFTAEGWTEEEAALADGPTGTATRYFKDTTVAAVSVSWQPSAAANCPTDQPISSCDVAPGQQNFTISIELVQIA